MDVTLTRLLLRRLIDTISILASWRHIVIVMLRNLLVAVHDLVELHLAV